MARTQAEDFDQKREVITTTAAELFATNGFSETSVASLAQECNISKSLLYHYFSSKEAILFAAMSIHINTLVNLVCRQRNESPRSDAFFMLTRELLQCYANAGNHQKILVYELPTLPIDMRREVIAKQRIIIGKVQALLAEISENDKTDRTRLRVKVMLYFGMLNWTHTWFKSTGSINRNELADEISNTILCSLEK